MTIFSESDGLVFDPVQITEKNEFGYVIPHGDHFHIIPPSKLSELERIAADKYLAQKQGQGEQPAPQPKPEEKPRPDKKPEAFDVKRAKAFTKNAQGKDGKTYTTSDGYSFTVESVIAVFDKGIVAAHGDHTHYIPFGDLDDQEIDALANYLNKNPLEKNNQGHQFTKEEVEQKLQYLAIDLGVPRKDLYVDGDQVIIPHGDHFHTKALADISLEKDLSQFLDKNHQIKPGYEADYQDFILNKKLGQIAYKYKVNRHKDLIVSGHLVHVKLGSGEQKVINLNEWQLDFEHPEVHFEERPQVQVPKPEPAPENPNEKPKDESSVHPEAPESESPWKTLSFAEKQQIIAQYYKVSPERIHAFAGNVMISGETEEDENIIIDEQKFLEIYKG